MNRQMSWLTLLCGVGALLGCSDRPCETTAQCGGGEVCAAAVCRQLTCEQAFFAMDPKSGDCVPLSGCFLTDEQLHWKSCTVDPCQGLAEAACVTDRRCQPVYQNPQVELRAGRGGEDAPTICAGGGRTTPPLPPDPDGGGTIPAPGVNNGDAPKHRPPPFLEGGCVPNTARTFAGCRAVAQITPQKACGLLSKEQCVARRDCTTEIAGRDDDAPVVRPGPLPQPGVESPPGSGRSPVCFDRVPRPASCEFGGDKACLLNPACQPIGARCYCPPGASCACSGGQFLGCEPNDRLRRCTSQADCGAAERCDRDEACIAPRTWTTQPTSMQPVPGTGSCLGACVSQGCAGFGEKFCHEHPECNAGVYSTVCRPKPYCTGGDKPLPPEEPGEPGDPTDPTAPTPGVGATCGCETEFTACAEVKPEFGIRAERSLLVRDPEIVSDPLFRFDSVVRRLAPAGQEDRFISAWFDDIGKGVTLQNGAVAQPRRGFAAFLGELRRTGPLTLAGVAPLMHTTALVNRLDLAQPGDCGEARLTYALSRAYTDGNQRMTVIFEIRVPDDKAGCRTVAQRWGELSMIDSAATRLLRLRELYTELLKPENLAQIRTNEFLNRFGREAWELREFNLDAQGLPVLVPVKQTVAPQLAGTSALLTWARDSVNALKAGTAVVPAQFLAAASTENGARLRLAGSDRDQVLRTAEKALNELSCAGCHLTETQSPFTHIGERLGRRVGARYEPAGRAVIDEFMRKELVSRAANLRAILAAPPKMLLAAPWRAAARTRVH